ncbi:hypothetical protein C0995_003789 [Termitomyces sp. Mi166|nr:hypothetical protein C0995_003789 [Termitomyces sp. Mi166\
MPPRASTRAQPRVDSPPAPSIPQEAFEPDPLKQLRTNWKWAAFSQFFFTFNHLFAMNDVSLNEIEEDLVHGTSVVLPRIMQRLLYTVSYDRKVSLENWQTALRKQYRKRGPTANPIGPEPRVEEPEQESSPPPEEQGSPQEPNKEQNTEDAEDTKADLNGETEDAEGKMLDSTRASTIERGVSVGDSVIGPSMQPSESGFIQINQTSFTEEPEESKNWLDLPMLTKLDSMHLLTEWQFQNPTRLRTLMRSDDENASWRIEPVGYDSKKNAYWLIGADRLWIQRPIPKPARPKTASRNTASLKRKRTADPVKATVKGKGRAAPPPPAKKQRVQEADTITGRSRAAKSQAKAKLDAQAKELAELNRQATALARSSLGPRSSPKKAPPSKAVGTRSSRRLRGNNVDDDEWEAVPEEWLNGDKESRPSRGNGKRGGTKEAVKATWEDGSEISELTELTEESGKSRTEDDEVKSEDEDVDEDKKTKNRPVKGEEVQDVPEAVPGPADNKGLEEQPVLPEGFIEWETICVTLYEWEHVAERFEKATHYAEKAMYKVLVNNIVPVVTEELRELERKQKLAAAITQRKRSSRLMLRQVEREEAEAAERKRREELEKTSRARRLEARVKKEEEEREKRELAREMRRREREEREGDKSEKPEIPIGPATPAEGSDVQVDVVGDGDILGLPTKKQHTKPPRKDVAASGPQNGRIGPKAGGSGSKTPVGEDWELDCEICLRRGINADDGTPMMSCGSCSKWQHIACHDRADQQAGRKRRNWNLVEFFCAQCRAKRTGVTRVPSQHMPLAGQGYIQQNTYMNLGAQYSHSNYSPYGSANGSTSYSRENQMSDARLGVPSRALPHGQPHQQRQAYGAPLTFSHYQPQQRGFSSTTEPLYGHSSHTQPYGYSSQSPYPQHMVNGHHYQQTSQARWNVNTSSQRSTTSELPATTTHLPYNVGGDRGGPVQSAVPPAAPPRHWQQPPQHQTTPTTLPLQHGSQYRYHAGASYPPGPP